MQSIWSWWMKSKVNVEIRRIKGLMDGSQLNLAPGELDASIVHTGHRSVNSENFTHGQVEITSSRAVKYLDICLDNDFTFVEHVTKTKLIMLYEDEKIYRVVVVT